MQQSVLGAILHHMGASRPEGTGGSGTGWLLGTGLVQGTPLGALLLPKTHRPAQGAEPGVPACPRAAGGVFQPPFGAGSCANEEVLLGGNETSERRHVESEPVSSNKRESNLH